MSTGNPYEPSATPPGGYPGGGDRAAAESKVAGPAIALIVVGALNILGAFYWIFQGVMVAIMPAEEMQRQMEAQNPELRQEDMPFDMVAFMESFGVGVLVVGALALIVSIVIIMGGVKMKNLQSRGLAMTAAILAMIPCISPCCIVGLPIGIWAVVALSDPDVKANFR